jgi:hypothetical protein
MDRDGPSCRHCIAGHYERYDIEQIGDHSLSYILAMKKVIEPVLRITEQCRCTATGPQM